MKRFIIILFLVIIAVITFYMSGLINGFPTTTYEGIARYIVNDTIPKTQALNTVTAVAYDFRGYDTLCGSFILVGAAAGAAAVLRKTSRGGGKDDDK